MVAGDRRRSVVIFITLGSCIAAIAVAFNIGWVVLNWRAGVLLLLGLLFFPLIITGIVLNTVFLVREIRRNEQHDAFINAVTHELKTPVASIRLYLETLQKREVDEAKRREFYSIMLADSERLLNTIEQVLRAGRSSPSKRRIERIPIDLPELVRECMLLARTRHHLAGDSIHFTQSVPADAPATVVGDLEEIKAAVSNLLDNAIKYSGANVQVRVETARVDEKHVAVRVTDQGVGIPSLELKRIFRRFYRIPGSVAMRVKGTGLGLFIVRSVAERHGGRAFAESAGAGLGSTFTLQLPSPAPKEIVKTQ